MSSYNISKFVYIIKDVCLTLAHIPSAGRVLFLTELLLARESLCSYSELNQLRFLIKEFIGEKESLPILLKKINQFHAQLMPYMISYPKTYKSLFERLLSAQVSWFEGWKKYEKNIFIVYGDMVGFSKLAQKHNFDAAIKILNFRHLFFRNFKKVGGFLEASGGDSILGVFEDVKSAVEASLRILRLSQQIGIGARIGISYGDYLSDEQGRPIIGASINTAVRVADGGSKGSLIRSKEKTWRLKNSEWKTVKEQIDKDWGIWFSWGAIKKVCEGENQKIIEYLKSLNTDSEYEIWMYYKNLKGVSDGTNLTKGVIEKYVGALPQNFKPNNENFSLFLGIMLKTTYVSPTTS